LCSYNLQQCDATPQTPLGELTALTQTRPPGWILGRGKEGGKWRGKGKERAMGKEMERKGRGENEKRTKGKEEDGRKEKGRGGEKGGNFVQL